ncbi:MAG: hypothetical protein B6D58_08935 [candidate division Zixibacteria bacterium 4484_95]|nr:MAG: hypothetical protein B6D58_08935 [candidate division Zixibacteria bacterium 4484_95]
MRNKSFIVLLSVLGVLIIVYIIQNLSTGRKSATESFIQLFPDLNPSSVSYIKVYKQEYPDSGLAFAKKEGQWVISSYYDVPGKQSDIEKILQDAKNIKGEIRSTKPELFDDYEITDSLALHLEFLGPDSSEVAHFLVGKGVKQASRSSFIRNYNSDTVYMVNENFISRFAVWQAEPSKKMPVNRWTELKMADVNKDDVKSIEIVAKRKKYLFEKKEQATEDTLEPIKYVWQQIKPKKGKILDNPAELGFAKPKYIASITTTDGETISFEFGNMIDTTSKNVYAMVKGKPFVYKVTNYYFSSLFEKPFEKD